VEFIHTIHEYLHIIYYLMKVMIEIPGQLNQVKEWWQLCEINHLIPYKVNPFRATITIDQYTLIQLSFTFHILL